MAWAEEQWLKTKTYLTPVQSSLSQTKLSPLTQDANNFRVNLGRPQSLVERVAIHHQIRVDGPHLVPRQVGDRVPASIGHLLRPGRRSGGRLAVDDEVDVRGRVRVLGDARDRDDIADLGLAGPRDGHFGRGDWRAGGRKGLSVGEDEEDGEGEGGEEDEDGGDEERDDEESWKWLGRAPWWSLWTRRLAGTEEAKGQVWEMMMMEKVRMEERRKKEMIRNPEFGFAGLRDGHFGRDD